MAEDSCGVMAQGCVRGAAHGGVVHGVIVVRKAHRVPATATKVTASATVEVHFLTLKDDDDCSGKVGRWLHGCRLWLVELVTGGGRFQGG